MNPLQKLRDAVGEKVFGMTQTEALEKNVCIDCKKPIVRIRPTQDVREGCIYSLAGVKQYLLSAQCEYCYDKLFETPEDPADDICPK